MVKWKIGNKTVDILPPVKQYMNAIERRLRVGRATRVRIMTELAGDFESRREAGQTDQAIMDELGTPEEVAAQFNAAFGAAGRPSRWRWIFVVLAAVVAAVVLVPIASDALAARQAASLGVIGGADGPTAIYVTAGPAAGFTPQMFLPWLLGCAAGFWLPTWRNPHACKGYAPSLLLSGLGALPLPVLALLFAAAGGFRLSNICSTFTLLLGLSAFCGALLCAVVFCRALWVRHRNRQAAGREAEKN